MQRLAGSAWVFFFILFLSIPVSAQPEDLSIQNKIDALLKFHGGMDIAAYGVLGKNYYYGLEGFPEDKQESYFWFNACLHEGDGQMSMQDNFRYMEEAVDMARQQFKEKLTGVHMMGKMLVEPQARQYCADFVDYINKYLPQLNNDAVQKRIEAWKKTHPLPVDTRTPAQKKQAELNYRFLYAINTNARLDPVGIKALIDAGADVSLKTLEHQKSALAVLVPKRNAEVLALVLQAHRFDREVMQEALKTAYLNGDKETAAVLIAHGAMPNERMYIFGLQGAMEQGDFAQVDYFLKKGAHIDLDAFEKNGPAGKLIAKGDNKMLALYLSLLPAPMEYWQGNMNAMLASAGQQGNIEAMQILLGKGAEVNPVMDETPLMKAIRAKQDRAVDFLLKHGAALDGADGGSARLMKEAFYAKNQATIELLMQAGIPLTAEHKELLAQCKFRKEICSDGTSRYGGPPKCGEELCRFQSVRNKGKLEKIIDHPMNEKNTTAADILRNGKEDLVDKTIAQIMAAPETYTPATLHVMAERLFARFRDDEGIFWHMAADLRARGDRYICKTVTPKDSGDRDLWSSPIFDFLKRRRMEDVLETVPKVVAWDRQTPYAYNIQWGFWETSCMPPAEQVKKREEVRHTYRPEHMPEILPVEAAWQNKMEDMLEKAEKGDVNAQYQLGHCYAYIHRCHRPLKEIMAVNDFQAQQEKERRNARGKQKSNIVKVENYKGFEESDALNVRKWLQKAVDNGHPYAARDLADVRLSNPFTPEEKAAAYEVALQKFKQGDRYAYTALKNYSPEGEGNKKILEYAFLRVMAEVEKKAGMSAADRLYKKFTEGERKIADQKAEAYIKKYAPLFNSEPKEK